MTIRAGTLASNRISPGDGKLTYRGVRALADAGADLRRAATGDAAAGARLGPDGAYLPAAAASALAHYYDLRVDDARPSIVDVRLSAGSLAVKAAGEAVNVGAFSLGDSVDVVVVLSRAVVVLGSPKLLLNARGGFPTFEGGGGAAATSDGSAYAYAAYVSGSGTAELVYRYAVADGDATAALSHASTRSACRSGLVADVRDEADAAGLAGAERLSLAATVRWPAGAACPRTLVAEGGGGGAALAVLRAAERPEVGADLSLPEPGYATLAGAATSLEAAGVALSATTSLEAARVSLDTNAPRVVNVTSPNTDDVYGTGAVLVLRVAFDAPVVVAGAGAVGALALALENRDDGAAIYARGNGSSVLEFEYVVEYGDASGGPLDYSSAGALTFASASASAGDPAGAASERVRCGLVGRGCAFVGSTAPAGVGINRRSTAGPGYLRTPPSRSNPTRFP